MAEVMLFHHALGQTTGFHAFADDLRRAGHTVHTPDLFDGRTFESIGAGVAFAEEIGFGEVIERGARAAEGLPAELVYAGFSLGVLPAQKLAQPAPERAARCCSTPACRLPNSGLRGRPTCRCRSTAWTPTRSSLAKATSTPPARLSSWPRMRNSSSTPATSTTSPTRACRRTVPALQRYSGNVYWSSSRPADRGRGMGVEFAPWPAHIAHRRGRSPSSASRARTARDPSGVAS